MLFLFSLMVLTIVTQQGDIAVGNRSAGYYAGIATASSHYGSIITAGVSMALLTTGIVDMVYHGENMASTRRCINIAFLTLVIAYFLSWLCVVFGFLANADPGLLTGLNGFALATMFAMMVTTFVLIVIAHRTMRKVGLYPTVTPPVVYEVYAARHDHRSYSRTRHR